MAVNPLTSFRPTGVTTDRTLAASPFMVLQRQMNRLLEDVFGPDASGFGPAVDPARGILSPRLELTETAQDIRLAAELPGVKEQDIEVSLEDDVLTLRAEKKAERKDERENTHFTERSFGVFQRSMQLPFKADPDAVNAAFEHGVLTITVPKPKAAEQQRRRIEVRGASRAAESPQAAGNNATRPEAAE
jgi:HSP20 family protein